MYYTQYTIILFCKNKVHTFKFVYGFFYRSIASFFVKIVQRALNVCKYVASMHIAHCTFHCMVVVITIKPLLLRFFPFLFVSFYSFSIFVNFLFGVPFFQPFFFNCIVQYIPANIARHIEERTTFLINNTFEYELSINEHHKMWWKWILEIPRNSI